jgi:hypothetical protein
MEDLFKLKKNIIFKKNKDLLIYSFFKKIINIINIIFCLPSIIIKFIYFFIYCIFYRDKNKIISLFLKIKNPSELLKKIYYLINLFIFIYLFKIL